MWRAALPLAIAAAARSFGAAATDCVFVVGADIQVPAGLPGAGAELKVEHADTAQACCDACGATPGCAGAAWNGNSEAHLNRCYMKGAGAAIVPGKSSPGTITCQPKETLDDGGWGAQFLLVVGVVVAAYVGGGVALSGRKGGLRVHPHHQRWTQLAGLVADGLATVRGHRGGGGGRASARAPARRQASSTGARPAQPGSAAGGRSSEPGAAKSKRPKEKRTRTSGRDTRDGEALLLGQAPQAVLEAARGGDKARAPAKDTASAGGGRWVHLPST